MLLLVGAASHGEMLLKRLSGKIESLCQVKRFECCRSARGALSCLNRSAILFRL